MSTSLIYHTQGIQGFQHESFSFSGGCVVQRLKRKNFRCLQCNSRNVSRYQTRRRKIQALPYGQKPTFFELDVHQLYCFTCGKKTSEQLPFLSHPKARLTKAFERTIVELRRDMTISALSDYFKVRWHTIKEIEKRHLQRKYARIPLKTVKVMGIDEIAYGRDEKGKIRFWTIARDLKTGAVLHVDKGKDGDSLKNFLKRLRQSGAKIEVVAMDMAKAYISWVKKNLPGTKIVFDHFHVIKLMNDKIDKERRELAKTLDKQQADQLKNMRYILLRNEENLKPNAQERLEALKAFSEELCELHTMKEELRSIYRTAENELQAALALGDWCEKASVGCSKNMRKMAKTIHSHWEGIIAYWSYGGLTNAAMEGFNNKVKTMIRQAYGLRDLEYMRLKIFDLPKIRQNDDI